MLTKQEAIDKWGYLVTEKIGLEPIEQAMLLLAIYENYEGEQYA